MKTIITVAAAAGIALMSGSCAASGESDSPIISDTLFPENRLAFGQKELDALLSDAYAELVAIAEGQGIDYATIGTAASIKPARSVAADVSARQFNPRKKVITDVGPALEQGFGSSLNQLAQRDSDTWNCRSSIVTQTVCKAAQVTYPEGLLLPDSRASLREELGQADDVFEYLLIGQLRASLDDADNVHFDVDLELISMVTDADPIRATRGKSVPIPVDKVNTIREGVDRVKEMGDLLGKAGDIFGGF